MSFSKLKVGLLIFSAAIFVFSFALSGCKPAPSPATESATTTEAAAATETVAGKPFEGVVLNVVNMLGWNITKAGLDHLAEFEEKTGIKVKLNEMPFADIVTKEVLEGENRSGAYDVLQAYDAGMATLKPYVIPLDVGNVDDWNKAHYVSAVDYVTFDNKIYFEPFVGGCQIGFYRKALFEDPKEQADFKAKYNYDLKPPTTWQEVLDIAKFFTRDTNNDGEIDLWGLAIPGKGDHGGCAYEEKMYSMGSGYTDENLKLLWPADRDKLVEWAKFDQDLVQTYKVTPSGCVSMEMAQMMELYFAGKAAMCESWVTEFWPTVQSEATKAKIGETGSFKLPIIEAGNGTTCGWWGWGISRDSKNPGAAMEFIKWFNSADITKIMLKGSSFLSPTIALTQWGIDNGYIPQATAEASKTSRPFVVFPQLPELRVILATHHEELLTGSITPEQFVDTCTTEMLKVLEDAGIKQ